MKQQRSTAMARTSIYDSTTRRIAIFIGLMFLTATATFVAGDAVVTDVLKSTRGTVDSGQLTFGVALLAVDALAVAAIGAAFVPVLHRPHRWLAYSHLAVRALECLVIVGISLYMLAEHNLVNYEPIIYVFTGTAGLLSTTAVLRTGIIAPWLARLGVIGYLAILAAMPIELLTGASLDSVPGMLLYVPGGMFELFLPIVLITRGFRRSDAPKVRAVSERQPAAAAA
jgi:hypothetical protein